MLAKKLLKITREPSAVSQKSSDNGSGDGTASETGSQSGSSRLGALSRKGSVWSQIARKAKTNVPRVRYENTYQLEPGTGTQFDPSKVRAFVEELLEMRLKTETYNPKTASTLTANLADVIKGRVKKMGFPRHKIVCHLVIGEQNRQDVNVCSRCVWDTATDSSATARYSNASLYVVATIYAMYFE